MFSTPIASHIPILNTAFDSSAFQQDGGGFWSLLDFASVLILFGVVVVLLGIIGPSIRRIAVIEFIEPPKDGTAQKSSGIFGRREQIALVLLGIVLSVAGFVMKTDSVKVEPACPVTDSKGPSIRIRVIGKACGCSSLDFPQIQVDSPTFPVNGEWFNSQPNTELWAFLLDSNDTVLKAKQVNFTVPDKTVWNTSFILNPQEDGVQKRYIVSVMVLNETIANSLRADKDAKRPINMPNSLLEQDVVIERVEAIDDPYSLCSKEVLK